MTGQQNERKTREMKNEKRVRIEWDEEKKEEKKRAARKKRAKKWSRTGVYQEKEGKTRAVEEFK